jgi:hypothetical protein
VDEAARHQTSCWRPATNRWASPVGPAPTSRPRRPAPRTRVDKSQDPPESARYRRPSFEIRPLRSVTAGKWMPFALPTNDWHESCKKSPQAVAVLARFPFAVSEPESHGIGRLPVVTRPLDL